MKSVSVDECSRYAPFGHTKRSEEDFIKTVISDMDFSESDISA